MSAVLPNLLLKMVLSRGPLQDPTSSHIFQSNKHYLVTIFVSVESQLTEFQNFHIISLKKVLFDHQKPNFCSTKTFSHQKS